ncbi:MAG: hypothetical protein CVV04_03765 [Firmicutes bacterium HGW-Firmicutes-9]|nr:MAG: hypothetical protein CVV04_03765 [Firmicutes bacterium HGW-Firmicutes-9]
MIFGDFFTETRRVFASIFPTKNARENRLKKAREQAVFLDCCNLFTYLLFRCFCALLRMCFLRVTLE